MDRDRDDDRMPLRRDELVVLLRAHAAQLRDMGVTSLSLFGSRARGDFRPDSDLDVLIEYDSSRKFSLVDMAGVQNAIEDLVGFPVQVTLKKSLREETRRRIQRDEVGVF